MFRKRHDYICSNSVSNHHLEKEITSKETKSHLECALRVRPLHSDLGLVVSLRRIWQERTLFMSES